MAEVVTRAPYLPAWQGLVPHMILRAPWAKKLAKAEKNGAPYPEVRSLTVSGFFFKVRRWGLYWDHRCPFWLVCLKTRGRYLVWMVCFCPIYQRNPKLGIRLKSTGFVSPPIGRLRPMGLDTGFGSLSTYLSADLDHGCVCRIA